MSEKMSKKERLLRAIRHQEPDRVPLSPRIWAWLLEYYGSCSWKEHLRAAYEFDFEPIIIITPNLKDYISSGIIDDNCEQLKGVSVKQRIEDRGDIWIVYKKFTTPAGTLTERKIVPKPKRRYGISPNPKIIEPLLKSPEDLPKLSFLLPDPDLGGYSFIREITEIVGENGLVAVHPTEGSDLLTVSVMGVENAMINYKLDRNFLENTLSLFHEYKLKVTKKCLEAGAQVIYDDWFNISISGGWSPQAWKELVFPKVKEICELVHSYDALYFYYDDGKLMKILPYLAEIGVDILETCTPPPSGDFDLKIAKVNFGNLICFKGVIDTVNIMMMGTPEKIREKVAEVIKIGAPGGGFILGTSDSIRDGTPLENVKAFFKAGREFGKYPVK